MFYLKAMQNELCSKEEKLKLLKKAMKSHNDYKLDAMNGSGCDRSLFALGVVSKLSGLELPKIFTFPVSFHSQKNLFLFLIFKHI